jgi:hypothetical protein
MTKPETEPKDAVWEMTKKATPVNFIFPILGAGVSYAAYADDLAYPDGHGKSDYLLRWFASLYRLLSR